MAALFKANLPEREREIEREREEDKGGRASERKRERETERKEKEAMTEKFRTVPLSVFLGWLLLRLRGLAAWLQPLAE